MRLRATASTALIATALLLAGCSGGGDSPTDGGAEPAPEETTPEVVAIPVGEPFGEAQWSVQTEANPTPPLVASDRVVALVQGEARAWDAEGAEAWEVVIPESSAGSEPVLRQVDAETVAVVSTGETEGEGLDEGGYAATVTLIDLASGQTTEVEVTDAESAPVLSEFGLAFILPSGGAAVVTADGQTQEVTDIPEPTTDSGEFTSAIGTVGDTVVVFTEDGSEEQTGYSTDTWSTGDLGLLDYTHTSTIEAVDQGQGLLVVGAHTSGAGGEDAYAVVDAETGDVLSEVECSPSTFGTATNSPNGQHGVVGPLVLSGTEAQCVGGGDGQQEVTLTAVADDGTAFGRASQGDLVVAPAGGGEPETSALPEGASPPVGVLSNGLAVHHDEETGIVTGNPVE